MKDTQTWQVHAYGNQDGADLALRVTITGYDAAGFETGTKTWRRHVRGLQFDVANAQATAIVLELYKLMDHQLSHGDVPSEIDNPLF